MKRRTERGLSLIELVVVFSIAVLIIGITISSLKPGKDKTSSLALAAAIADEFRAARQLAISHGYPVAIGIPTGNGGSQAADSVYRLEGWNVPRITWSQGYGGDYPQLGFAAARWSPASGTFSNGATVPPLSKIGVFTLNTWVPAAHQNDSIFCFTPEGGIVTNALPALNDRYTVVIAKDPQFSAGTLTAGEEPAVVYISANGAVDYSKGTPGTTLSPAGPAPNRAAFKPREQLAGSAVIRLSEIVVRPNANDPNADAFCTPGQQVTFELFAYDPEGRELFTQWTQSQVAPVGGNKLGSFTFPRSTEGGLVQEAERMEYVPNPPAGINWGTAQPPPGGCFRSRWTWTVPLTSVRGDVFQVEADVQDATGNATIENQPSPLRLPAPPPGRLLVEIFNVFLNRWEIVRMNPDGSGRLMLTPVGTEETMPSVDHNGTKMAYLSGPPGNVDNRRVKVRSLTGGGEFTITPAAGRYTSVSISPDGGWLSYRLDGTAPGQGTNFIQRIDQPAGTAWSFPQNWGGSVVDVERSRTGWSEDGRYAVWGNDTSIIATDLTNGTNNTIFTYSPIQNERIFAPTCFRPMGTGPEKMLFTIGNINPVLGHIPFNPTGSGSGSFNDGTITLIDLNAGGGGAGSSVFDDNLPSVSIDGHSLILPREDRSIGSQRSALVVDWVGNDTTGNFISTPPGRSLNHEIRSATWLP
jgi:type II secretory pathway pseudopilin PulG